MGNPKGNIPWNKGKHGIYTEETRRRIGLAKSKKKTPIHKQRISESMKKIKQCGQCSIKNKWIYKVCMPFSKYNLDFCTDCFLSQYFGLSSEERKGVRILS